MHFQIFNYNKKHGIYNLYHFSTKKIRCVKFPFKAVTVYSKEEEEFNYKNNHDYSKSTNSWLDNISKINYKILVVLSYRLSRLGLRKI